MYKILVCLYTAFAFSQSDSIYKKDLYLEVCSTKQISMCGNYFEQNLMRESFLIALDKKDFLKSYDTVFSLDYKSLKKINNYVQVKKMDSLNIIYPNKFTRKINKFLNKNKFKEKYANSFKYIHINFSFKIKEIRMDEICIVNPDFCNIKKDSLYLIKKVVVIDIDEIFLDNNYNDNNKKEFLYIDRTGKVIR